MKRKLHCGLSLIEPWATLMVIGPRRGGKGIETRSWRTDYRGPFAIHASKKLEKDVCEDEPFRSVLAKYFGTDDFLGKFKLGYIIGAAELLHCERVQDLAPHQNANELAFGNYDNGDGQRYGFVCDYAEALREPIPARGMLNFWTLTPAQQNEISRQLPLSGFEVTQ